MYGIKTRNDYTTLMRRMVDISQKQLENEMYRGPRNIPPHLLSQYDDGIRLPEYKDKLLGIDNEKGKYKSDFDEFGHKIGYESRPSTTNELDTTVNRMISLESKQEDIKDWDKRFKRGKTTEIDSEYKHKMERIDKKYNDNLDEETSIDEHGNYIDNKEETKKEDDKYIGGDWRVRLGIASAPIEKFNMKKEVDDSWKMQLSDGHDYVTRHRYKMCPYAIKGMPYDEAKLLRISYKVFNVYSNK